MSDELVSSDNDPIWDFEDNDESFDAGDLGDVKVDPEEEKRLYEEAVAMWEAAVALEKMQEEGK